MARKPEQATLQNGRPAAATPQQPAAALIDRKTRYTESAQEADDFGRLIVVRRLRPSEQAKIEGMTVDLAGFVEIPGGDDEIKQIPRATRHYIAASVREIYDEDGVHKVYPFPRNRAELDAIFDYLDNEGLEAASNALLKLSKKSQGLAETKEDAKNS